MPPMYRYLLANWKSHKTLSEAEAWLDGFARSQPLAPDLRIILAPPVPLLIPLWQKLQTMNLANLSLAVQDLSPFPLGSYTGAVAAEMVSDYAAYAIVGHSERRRYFHENHQEVANKVREALAAGLTPIVCLDQPYAREQLAAIEEADLPRLLIGYGPVEAIGIEAPQSFAKAGAAIAAIRGMAPDTPILYGGSISKLNAREYGTLFGSSGLMVGSASLDPEEFGAIGRALSGKGAG